MITPAEIEQVCQKNRIAGTPVFSLERPDGKVFYSTNTREDAEFAKTMFDGRGQYGTAKIVETIQYPQLDENPWILLEHLCKGGVIILITFSIGNVQIAGDKGRVQSDALPEALCKYAML